MFTRKHAVRLSTGLTVAALALAAGSMVSSSGVSTATAQTSDAYANLPTTITIPAVLRDFRERNARNAQGVVIGHPDMEGPVTGVRIGTVADRLSSENKPVFRDRWGQTISSAFRDRAGRNIMPALADASRGDTVGRLASLSSPSASNQSLNSAEDFDMWYRDVPGRNMSRTISLSMVRTPGTNQYVFDSASHAPWNSLSGFFPLNGELFGNYASTGKNFHFTTEVQTEFVYERGKNQVFRFTGDDDVWVFVDGRLVIDLGGVHGVANQIIELDRLSWLVDGRKYKLAIFHAERHTTESNFRMETTIRLEPVKLPATAALHD